MEKEVDADADTEILVRWGGKKSRFNHELRFDSLRIINYE